MRRAGMTLYEVVLALAIFVGALAALGPLATTGMRAAVHAKLETQAILRCESKLAEVLAGVEPLSAVSDAAFDDASADGWSWNLIINNGPRADLMFLEVAVAHVNDAGDQDAAYSIVRMLRNPDVLADLMEDSSSSSNSSSSGSSSSSSSSGSSSQSSGSSSK